MQFRIVVARAVASTLHSASAVEPLRRSPSERRRSERASLEFPEDTGGAIRISQGTWPTGEMTGVPLLERPASFGERATLTDQEFAERQAQIQRRFQSFVIGAWELNPERRNVEASLIVDPPNGRMPALTEEGQKRSTPMGAVGRAGPSMGPRILIRGTVAFSRGLLPSMLPAQIATVSRFIRRQDVWSSVTR